MAEHDISPDELQLKKRARRRLVGAAALALFAVIVLPMVMDREPRPLSQDIQIRIPSQDSTGFTSKLVPGKPATPMPAPEPKPAAEQKPAAQAKADVASVQAAAPPATAKPGAQASVPAPAKPVEKPAAIQEKKSEPAEKPSLQEKKAEPAEKPATADTGQWVIQLGAYREAGKVKNLMSKLKGINVPAYTEKVETSQGSLTRVRAGPFASQEAAEKARGRVKIIGVDGPVAPK
jgi:DedD protein